MRRPRQVAVVVVTGAALLLVLALSWLALADILSVDRGLDITDEGLYLLSADPPTPTATWSFPFGWHTAPLFDIVDHDISRFRAVGAAVLAALSGWLGWSAVTVAVDAAPGHGRPHGLGARRRLSIAALGAFVGAAGSLLYYAGFLRTPSYNWVNLVGIVMAASAQLILVGELGRETPRRPICWILVVTGGFGLFFTVPAKPSTAVFMAAAGFGLMTVFSGARRAIAWTGALIAATAGWVAVAVVVRLWPTGFVPVFLELLGRPTPAGSQSLGGAVLSFLSVPIGPWRVFASAQSAPSTVVGSAIGAASTILGVYAVVAVRRRKWLWVVSCAGLGLASLMLAGVSLPQLERPSGNRWAFAPLVTACLLVVVGGAVFVTARRRQADEPPLVRGAGTPGLAVPLYLLLLPFFFSFGSSWGAYEQAANAAGVILIAAMALVALRPGRDALLASLGIAVMTVALTAVVIYDSREAPYRNPPIAQHDVPVAIGVDGHRLLLDPDLATVLTELGTAAHAAGWRQGTPVVGLLWRWSTTIPYHLGGTVQESLMLTIFGYVGTVERAIYNLDDPADEFPFSDAWVVATSPEALGELGTEQVSSVAAALAETSGRVFPDGYLCVVEVASFQLWRPADASRAESPAVDCPDPGISSRYDASFGWQPGDPS